MVASLPRRPLAILVRFMVCSLCVIGIVGCGARATADQRQPESVADPLTPTVVESTSTPSVVPTPTSAAESARVAAISLSDAGWRAERLNEDFAGAHAYYTAAIEADPSHAESWLRRAVVARRLGVSLSEADLQQGLALEPPAYLADYYQARFTSDVRRKLALYDQVIAAQPDFGLVYVSRAIILMSQQRYNEATHDVDTLSEVDPDYYEIPLLRGQIAELIGDYPQALEAYDQALRQTPDFGLALQLRGSLYALRLDNPARAIEDLEQAITLMPPEAEMRCTLAEARWMTGDVDGALADFATAIAVDPQYACSYYKRALLFIALDRPVEALADLDAYLAFGPSVRGYMTRSVLYQHMGDLDAALIDATRATTLDSQSAPAFVQLAEVQIALEFPDEARKSYQQALELFQKQGDIAQVAVVTARMQELKLLPLDA